MFINPDNALPQPDVFMPFLQNENPDPISQSNTDESDVNGSDGWEEVEAVSTKPNYKYCETVDVENLVVLKIQVFWDVTPY
jgi:hypothetical protein